jgi:drug/metabolite transporter (DMT)-like permease
MGAVLLGLLSAVGYGFGDFFGASSAKRAPAISVGLVAAGVGLTIGFVAALVVPGNPIGTDLLWGSVAGISGVIGIVVVFWAMAIGPMRVVAPLAAVVGAVVPFVVGLAIGERPGRVATVGAFLAIVALPLITREHHHDDEPITTRAVYGGIVAGLGFAGLFIAIDQVSEASGLWPLVAARLITTLILAGIVMGSSLPAMPLTARRLAVGAGIFDMGANIAFLLALRTGLLSLVAVLSSLYPIITIALARSVYHEAIGRTQASGIAIALAGTALIAAG